MYVGAFSFYLVSRIPAYAPSTEDVIRNMAKVSPCREEPVE